MVRVISAAAQAKLDQNIGTESVNIIEIQWIEDGSIYTYADKDLGGNEGKIIQISNLDNSIIVQGVSAGSSGDSQEISITIDDTDGTIKAIMDSNDIHKEAAWVYQSFTGLASIDKFLIFKGQISSPLQWNEGDRTITLDILTRIEDGEVGFSMEEGNFGFVPEDLVGKSWPLVFGTVKLCPALKTRTPNKGLLKTGFGIKNYMLEPKKEQVALVCCPWKFLGFRSEYQSSASGGPWGAGRLVIEPVFEKDVSCECKKRAIGCEMDLNLALQIEQEFSIIEIIDGKFFPQGELITLDIQGSRISGQFDGTTSSPSNNFTITNRIHPKEVLGDPLVPKIMSFGCDPLPDGSTSTTGNTGGNSVGAQVCVLPSNCGGWGSSLFDYNILEDGGNTKEQIAWNYLSSFREAGFFWAEPGSEVTVADDNQIVYECNLLPSTVHQVKAWRTFSASNLRQLTTVPNTYYTIRQSDFDPYTVTEVVFDRPLSSRGEGWEDDIFVTQTSSVGPNPVDIMEWLIGMYTSFTWDATFAAVKTQVDNYPMHFLVPGRKNILTLLQEMCWQGRMAMVLRNDIFSLIYLPEVPSEDGTIVESDVLAKSLVLDHTDTGELVTEFVAEWRPECNLEDPYNIVLRNNVKKYGTNKFTFDFYCYNIQELVIKSATFWLIRMSNTWRRIICKTTVKKLALETLDGVFVTLNDIASEQIKCRVETAVYNSADHTIDFILQTPVRSGETTAFLNHYPESVDVLEFHPTNEDIQFGNAGGSGPNVDVEAPEGHILGKQLQLTQGFTFGQRSPCTTLSGDAKFTRPIDLFNECRPDHGDQQPSDIDDEKPVISIESDNSIIPPQQSPVNEFTQAQIDVTSFTLQQEGKNGDLGNQINNATNTGTGNEDGAGDAGGAGGGSTSQGGDELHDSLKALNTPDELEDKNVCTWNITVQFLNIVSVRIKSGTVCKGVVCNDARGWCYCNESGATGCWVGTGAPQRSETFSFNSQSEREAALTSMIELLDEQGTVGQDSPVNIFLTQNTPSGCQGKTESDPDAIIGYAQNTEDGPTVVGFKGFMDTGGYVPNKCNF